MNTLDYIISLMDTNPDQFVQSQHTLLHFESGIEIWTANMPIFDHHWYPQTTSWSFKDKYRFWKAYRKWKKKYCDPRLKKFILERYYKKI